MARIKLPHINAFIDRHGKVRRYLRCSGRGAIPLPGAPGSPEFMEAYHAGLASLELDRPVIGASRSAPGTVSAAIAIYYGHNSFRHQLSVGTQRARRGILEKFRSEHGDKRLALLQRQHIAAILGGKTPNVARQWLKTLRGLMRFTVDMGLIKSDPTAGIKAAKPPKTEGWHSWTEAEIGQFEAFHLIGSKPRLAMALMLYTAIRRSDAVRLGPQHLSNGKLTVRAQKTSRTTGTTLEIPVHPALAEVLAKTPTTHLTYLVTEYGQPFTVAGFGGWFRAACDQAGLPNCSAHGLRKSSCRRLAEAGCSEHEIAAISGHENLSEVRTYTRAAAQSKLAQSAISAVTAAFPAKPGTENLQTLPPKLTNRRAKP